MTVPGNPSATGIGNAASKGAAPEGAVDEASASIAVKEMFNSIAHRYDAVNHILSVSVDRYWWWRTARRFRPILRIHDAEILDICCGTGDMTMALLKHRPLGSRPIVAADFAREMLNRGARKFSGPFKNHGSAIAVEADALHLPMENQSLDLITTAFGFRNLANYREGLIEFHRVLKPGGQLGILDFSEPGGLFGIVYKFYFRRILPIIGMMIGGRQSAYNYLPASVSKFPPPAEFLTMMREAGFADVQWTPYSFGIAGLWRGIRREDSAGFGPEGS